MISLEVLQAIDSIDRNGSFSAAAEELYRVPSALTYLIKKTEKQLNIKLFDRSKQRASLTPAGKLLLERGRDILQQVHRLELQSKEVDRGCESQLRIVVDTILPLDPLWPLLQTLQSEQPWLNIQILEEALSGAWEALLNDRADLIIGVTGDEPTGNHWHRQAIGSMQTILCCSPNHPAARLPAPLKHQELQHVTHIVVSDSARNLLPRNVNLLGSQQILAVANMEHKYQALIHGMGVSHLPAYLALPAIEKGLLQALTTTTEPSPQILYMAWNKEGKGVLMEKLREQIVVSNCYGKHLVGHEKLI